MKKLTLYLLVLSFFFVCGYSNQADASIIFNNGFRVTGALGGSDFSFRGNTGTQKGDDFVLNTTVELTGFHWYGSYHATESPRDNTPPDQDDFTIRLFYVDSNGIPESVPFFEQQSINVTRVDTGFDWHYHHEDYPIFYYEYYIPAITLTAGTYFVSFVNNTPDMSVSWFWSDSDSYDDESLTNWKRGSDGESWSKGAGTHHEWAFYLTDNTFDLTASVEVKPSTFNLKSKGKQITCYIELPENYDPSLIDVSTVSLIYNGTTIMAETSLKPIWSGTSDDPVWDDSPGTTFIEIPFPTELNDYDNDSILDLMVKFDRESLYNVISSGTVELTIIGLLTDGLYFRGNTSVLVIDKGKDHTDEDDPSSVVY